MQKKALTSVLVLLAACIMSNAANVSDTLSVNSQNKDSSKISTQQVADQLIDLAKAYIGTPYVWGAKGPKSFDCSGYTSYIYKQFGYSLSGSAIIQATQGREVKGSLSNMQKGDIIIFGSRANAAKVGHVGLYIGPDNTGEGVIFIHASVKGVRINSTKENYYKSRFLGVRRVLPDFYESPDSSGTADIFDGKDKIVVEKCDTLRLQPGDKRILLLANGSWVCVDSVGNVLPPETKEKIVLDTTGKWNIIKESTQPIPVLQKSAIVVSTTGSAQSASQYHTIVSGDTLSALAVKYHTTVSAICQLNGIKSTTILQIGKKIRVK